MDFIIVTGLSGAGKSSAIDVLEDIGYYCADNMPPQLICKFSDLITNSKLNKIAIVTDIRTGELFKDLSLTLKELKSKGLKYKIIFLDAGNNTIIRRYKETRRKHPLVYMTHGDINGAIEHERERLMPIRQLSDYVIDTSHLSVAQLKERISGIILGSSSTGMQTTCLSFGFKYGIPVEADLVFDVRCLPNPFYLPELKNKTGLDDDVCGYVMKFEDSQELLDKLYGLVDFLHPLYSKEGKSQLVIAIGCTGGHHRSVVFANKIHKHLFDKGSLVSVHHRDILKQY